jgi:cell division protein FtsX
MVTTSTALLLTTIGTLIVVLALLILFHQNMNATKGYRLRSLERERSQLLLEQEVQNMEIAKAQALETLEADNKVQSMKRVKKPQYIRTDSTVAQKSTLQNVE